MLNSYSSSRAIANNSLNINAVSGLILKNHPKSWFKRVSLKSDLAEQLFDNIDPYLYIKTGAYYTHTRVSVIVLQMMVCGDMEVIAELVKKEDYEVVSNE